MALVGLYSCIALAILLIAWVAYFLFCKEKSRKIKFPDFYKQNRELGLNYQHQPAATSHIPTAAKLTGAGILLLPGRSRKQDTNISRDVGFTNLPTPEGNDGVDIIKDALDGVDADVHTENEDKMHNTDTIAIPKEISETTTHASDSGYNFGHGQNNDSQSDWTHGSAAHGYDGAGNDYGHGGYDASNNDGGGYNN